MKKQMLLLFLVLSIVLCGGTVNAQWSQVGSDIEGEAAGDRAGWSVSLSADGKRLAVGANFNDGSGSNAGHVRIFEESGGTWSQIGGDIDGENANDFSGFSVSLSSDGARVAIGAFRNNGNGASAGHLRIFEESGGTWSQIGSDIDGESPYDYSGASVSLSADGKRVAVGATGGNSSYGYTKVFQESNGTWSQVGSKISGAALGDGSGYSVALSADGIRVAIGAYKNSNNGLFAGQVRIFKESGGSWVQVGSDLEGQAEDDQFGRSVFLSADGTRVAAGASRGSDLGNNFSYIKVFEDNGGVWTLVGDTIYDEQENDDSGNRGTMSLSADGTRVAIGATSNDDNSSGLNASINSGHVRIFEEINGAWTQIGCNIEGEAAYDGSGYLSLSADGIRVAIGAINNDDNGTSSGHTRVFEFVSITETIQPIVDAFNDGIANGTIQAASGGGSGGGFVCGTPGGGGGNLNGFCNHLLQAQSAGSTADAIAALTWCQTHSDGVPPDHITGSTAAFSDFVDLINEVQSTLDCSGATMRPAGPSDLPSVQPAGGEEISFFPNPASSQLSIRTNKYAGYPVRISVINLTGQEQWAREWNALPDELIRINLSGFSPGLYLLSIEMDKHERAIHKVVVSK